MAVQTPPKRGRRYPWHEWHWQFLTGSYLGVSDFLRSKGIDPRHNGNARRQVERWVEERSQISQRVGVAVQTKLADEMTAVQLAVQVETISIYLNLCSYLENGLKWRAMTRMQRRVMVKIAKEEGEELPIRISPFEFVRLAILARLILGLPTTARKEAAAWQSQHQRSVAELIEKLGGG